MAKTTRDIHRLLKHDDGERDARDPRDEADDAEDAENGEHNSGGIVVLDAIVDGCT